VKKKTPIYNHVPLGCISVTDAFNALHDAFYPGALTQKYDSLKNEERIQRVRMIRAMFEPALQNGDLIALSSIDKSQIPQSFWSDRAHPTAGVLIKDNTILMIENSVFQKWLLRIQGKPLKRGRQKGDGAIDDTLLLKEMQRLINIGEANSANDAARIVAPQAKGGGTDDTKRERLARKFRATRVL
jgi:hypothetical protein